METKFNNKALTSVTGLSSYTCIIYLWHRHALKAHITNKNNLTVGSLAFCILQFDVFEMGYDDQDYITIMVGSTDVSSAELYGRFSATSNLEGKIVYSTNNEMLIILRSDSRTALDRRGFSVTNLISKSMLSFCSI